MSGGRLWEPWPCCRPAPPPRRWCRPKAKRWWLASRRPAAERPAGAGGQAWVRTWSDAGPAMGGSFGWYGHPMRSHGFYVAPGYRRYYPGIPRWYGPWGYGGTWSWAPPAWPVELPTRDMLVHVVPEGVREEGGVVDGFIYFPVLPPQAQSVRFSFERVDANTGEPQGAVSLAFDAR